MSAMGMKGLILINMAIYIIILVKNSGNVKSFLLCFYQRFLLDSKKLRKC